MADRLQALFRSDQAFSHRWIFHVLSSLDLVGPWVLDGVDLGHFLGSTLHDVTRCLSQSLF